MKDVGGGQGLFCGHLIQLKGLFLLIIWRKSQTPQNFLLPSASILAELSQGVHGLLCRGWCDAAGNTLTPLLFQFIFTA